MIPISTEPKLRRKLRGFEGGDIKESQKKLTKAILTN
jgi:hypothetical protein